MIDAVRFPPAESRRAPLADSRAAIAAWAALPFAGLTNLQETSPLVWVLLGLSVGGALITWGILAYAIWRFRDPSTKGRRYG